MMVRPGTLAGCLMGLGAILFLLSYFWIGYNSHRNWTEERAQMWIEAGNRLHSLRGSAASGHKKSDPHAQAELEAAQVKFETLGQEREAILNSSRWWANFLWGSGVTLMLCGIGVYSAAATGAFSENG